MLNIFANNTEMQPSHKSGSIFFYYSVGQLVLPFISALCQMFLLFVNPKPVTFEIHCLPLCDCIMELGSPFDHHFPITNILIKFPAAKLLAKVNNGNFTFLFL